MIQYAVLHSFQYYLFSPPSDSQTDLYRDERMSIRMAALSTHTFSNTHTAPLSFLATRLIPSGPTSVRHSAIRSNDIKR
jgi:hypothetical protein